MVVHISGIIELAEHHDVFGMQPGKSQPICTNEISFEGTNP